MTTRLAAEHRTAADLNVIGKRQREFKASLKRGNHLEMSEANKNFHMAIADAGRNPYLSSFYERLLTQGRRMLHMHFEYLKKPTHGYLLTDEHDDMLRAIEKKNVDLADKLAHEHTRQFRDQFIDFMKENYVTNVSLTKLRESA
jgi:DNA-binding GntR family transcriptional regulator